MLQLSGLNSCEMPREKFECHFVGQVVRGKHENGLIGIKMTLARIARFVDEYFECHKLRITKSRETFRKQSHSRAAKRDNKVSRSEPRHHTYAHCCLC